MATFHRRVTLARLLDLILVIVAITMQFVVAASARASAGDLFATDSVTNSIIAYSTDGTMRTFATGLDNPQGLTFDTLGNLYVADMGSGTILKYAADGTRSTFISGLLGPMGLSFAGSVLLVSEHDGGQVSLILPDGSFGTPRPVSSPLGVAFHNLEPDPEAPPIPSTWVASNSDPASSFVREYNPDGSISDYALGEDPRDIAFSSFPNNPDVLENAYVSSGNGAVLKISVTNGTEKVFISGLGDLHGLAFRPARFGEETPGAGNLLAADTSGGHIYEITPDAVQTTFASDSNPNFLAFEPNLFGKLVNISTRLSTLTGDNVLIAGFIITGTSPRQVVLRGIGSSLSELLQPVAGALEDPVLELHEPDGTVVTNDNWMDNTAEDQATLMDNGLAPTDDLESAIVVTLAPGPYTAILRGQNEGTGVAMVEAYDLDPTSGGEAGNISTRGFVGTDDEVMIAGFMIDQTLNEAARVLIRAIGPTLADLDVPNPLQDPTLELHDITGATIAENDDWADTAETEIANSGIAPQDGRESAILANLAPGEYTAIVRSVDNSTGIALVEAYHLP